jgi:hypothetical protein
LAISILLPSGVDDLEGRVELPKTLIVNRQWPEYMQSPKCYMEKVLNNSKLMPAEVVDNLYRQHIVMLDSVNSLKE